MTSKEKSLYLRCLRRIIIDVYPVEYAHHHIEIDRNGDVVFHRHGDRFSTRRKKSGFDFDGNVQEAIAELLFDYDDKCMDSIDKKNVFEWRMAFYTIKGCYKKCTGFIPRGICSESPFVNLLSQIEECINIDFGLQYLKSKELASCMAEAAYTSAAKPTLSMDDNKLKQIEQLSGKLLTAAVQKNNSENIIISPISIMIILSILARTAAGTSQKEIERLFGLKAREIWETAIQINGSLEAQPRIVSSANALYMQNSVVDFLNPEIIPLLSTAFGIQKFDSNCTASDINNWISEKTGGMITHFINRIQELGDIALLNAIRFEAKWAKEYKAWDVDDGEFHALDGTIQNAAMLCSKEQMYLSNEHAYGFMKPYKNCGYSYMAILPRHTQDPVEMLKKFQDDDLADLILKPVEAIVDVTMPEFSFDQSISVKDMLKCYDVSSVFDPETADISGLLNIPGSYISNIVHKARIEVNRNGTRAAAISAMCVTAGCVPEFDYYKVILNRPFLFGIINNQTGIPLFLGIVNRL